MSSQSQTILFEERRNSDKPLRALRSPRTLAAISIGLAFVICVAIVIIAGRHNSGYRLQQYVSSPVHARVDFAYFDPAKFTSAQQRARELEPRVYRPSTQFAWSTLQEHMRQWPDLAAGRMRSDLPEGMKAHLDYQAISLLAQYQAPERRALFTQRLESFFTAAARLVVIPAEQRDQEIARHTMWRAPSGYAVNVSDGTTSGVHLPMEKIYAADKGASLKAELTRIASETFREDLAPQVVSFVLASLAPTHVLDESATVEAQEHAARSVRYQEGDVQFKAGMVIKGPGEVEERDLAVLQAEQRAYYGKLDLALKVRDAIGVLGLVGVITAVLYWYVRRYQPRILRNSARAFALAALLLAMLLLSQLAAAGTRPLFFFGVAPTIFTAIVLAIAYEPRFALGASLMLACLVSMGLNQGLSFLLTLMGGCTAACAFVHTVRTRGRLIEIGFASGIAMIAVTMFSEVMIGGAIQPFDAILRDSLHAGVAGLGSGFVVLGILPFLEKAFRITTGMTLLELSDSSHPLQRKMAAEAPGTYSHSLQVATLAEAAAEAIGANSLLARVGALYHDVGKSKRAHYFCENQAGRDNAHLALSPGVSFMIIVEHIKDGMELARSYHLPTSLFPFIQQHHGTTLVEFFYHEACKQGGQNATVEESAFRYPGPKPRSREIAIVMLADACESAARAMPEPSPERLEKLVHQLIMKRLLDGQLSDCDLTIRELDTVEKTLVRTIQSLHHMRIAYPDNRAAQPVAATGS